MLGPFYSLVDSFGKNKTFLEFIKLLTLQAYTLVYAELIYLLSSQLY